MKKIYFLCFLSFFAASACKHAPILPDVEYLNEAADTRILEYINGFKPSTHDVLTIGLETDNLNQRQLNLSAHINYNHTLEAMRVGQNDWWAMPEHFKKHTQSTTLSNETDHIVNFEIRSKTPQNEVMTGSVLVPKAVPIRVTALGNNHFKLNWSPQRQRQRVLIYLNYLHVYVQRFNHGYAVETDDDGEFILTPSVFTPFNAVVNGVPTPSTETVEVNIVRANPARRTVVKQPSTGTEYAVFGGKNDTAIIVVEP